MEYLLPNTFLSSIFSKLNITKINGIYYSSLYFRNIIFENMKYKKDNIKNIMEIIVNFSDFHNHTEISENKSITPEYIIKYKNSLDIENIELWWFNVSKNIDINFVIKTYYNNEFIWNISGILMNEKVTIDFLNLIGNELNLLSDTDWDNFSLNTCVISEILYNNVKFRWNWDNLSSNLKITEDFITDTINDKRFKWNWELLTKNKNISYDFIINTLNDERYNWDKIPLIKRPISDQVVNNIILEHLKDNIERGLIDYNDYDLSYNTLSILEHPEITWYYFINHATIDSSTVKHIKNMDSTCNVKFTDNVLIYLKNNTDFYDEDEIKTSIVFYDIMSSSKQLNTNIVNINIYQPWNWYKLSLNPNITEEYFLEKYNDKRYKFKNNIATNPSISMDFIEFNIDKFDPLYVLKRNDVTIYYLNIIIAKQKNKINKDNIRLMKNKKHLNTKISRVSRKLNKMYNLLYENNFQF